jgi:hypothetical protein
MSDYNNVEIRVFASPKVYASRDLQDQPRVAEIIRSRVLPLSEAEYHRVDVKIRRNSDQTPRYLVAYLLRKDIYLAEVVRVDVESNFQVTNVTRDYDESEEEDDEEEEGAIKSEYTYDFVAATPVPDIDTAKKAVEKVCEEATKVGLKCKVLLGLEATVANYQMYLTSGLKGFVNVGHGSPNGIVLYDGTLNATWFNSIANQAVKPAVVYFNSCQVHNDPLKSAVMKAGADTYIGGIVNLLIGPSEEVCKCFWGKVVTSTTPMGDALHQCEKDHYPSQGAHGISGNTGPFVICQGGPSLLAYEQFMFTANKKFSGNANVASVTFKLPREMYVTFVAESSATIAQGGAPKRFITGLYTGDSPNAMWTASYREGSFQAANQHVPVHTSFAMKLPAGTHTMYWKIWLNGYTIELDSGTLTALAVPCSMGGQLKEGIAEKVMKEEAIITTRDPGQPDLYITIDRSADIS